MHTSEFGVYQLLSIISVCYTLSHVCASIRSRVRILQHSQQAEAHIIPYGHIWEGRSRLSVKCTPPTLVLINSSPSPLSVKFCPMWVHRSVQDLEINRIFSRLMPISYATSILWRTISLCPSNAHIQLWCLSAPLHHICLLNFVPCVSIDPFKI